MTIERQTIGGRRATVAYLTADFQPATKDDHALAKLLFDDGQMILLAAPDDGGHEVGGYKRQRTRHAAPIKPHFHANADEGDGYGRHRAKHRAPFKHHEPDDGEMEAAAFGRYRIRHANAFTVVINVEPGDPSVLPEVFGPADLPVKLQLVAWAKAIMVLDKSEVLVRDLIERELAGKTGSFADAFPTRAIRLANRLALQVKDVRDEALRTAFRLLRARLGNMPVLTVSFSAWAAYFSREDHRAISAAIQAGLSEGLDSTEIARRVVGSLAMNGVDGVTEYTRNKIAHLGRAAIRSANLRKQGLDPAGATLHPLKGLDPDD